MSDPYIPEFMELDSYWQKAVDDAINDSIKVQKRLQNALKNKKKVNEKLEMLGNQQKNQTSGLSKCKSGSTRNKELSQSASDKSISSEDDEPTQTKYPKNKNTQENKTKTPDRSFLGNGSLEKMKKSQNSFNVEPMGMDDGNEESDCDNSDDGIGGRTERKLQYLHFKNNSDFERSDSESSIPPGIPVEKNEIEKLTTATGENSSSGLNTVRVSLAEKQKNTLDTEMKMDKITSENRRRQNSDLERRLHLALAKRDILNENLRATSIGKDCSEIKVNRSAVKIPGRKRKAQQLLSPFIRFYLEVYRELCHKCSENKISQEAGKRWWNMSAKERASYAKLRRRK